MAFVDTNVLLSYAFVNDLRHSQAKKFLEEIRKVSLPLYISPIAIFEIYCVVPRRIIPYGGYRLPDPLQKTLEKIPVLEERLKESTEVVISYLRSELDLRLCSDGEIPELGQLEEVLVTGKPLRLFRLYLLGIQKSYKLRVSALDLLHVTYVYEYAKRGYPSLFVTFDGDIKKDAEAIKREIGVEIR